MHPVREGFPDDDGGYPRLRAHRCHLVPGGCCARRLGIRLRRHRRGDDAEGDVLGEPGQIVHPRRVDAPLRPGRRNAAAAGRGVPPARSDRGEALRACSERRGLHRDLRRPAGRACHRHGRRRARVGDVQPNERLPDRAAGIAFRPGFCRQFAPTGSDRPLGASGHRVRHLTCAVSIGGREVASSSSARVDTSAARSSMRAEATCESSRSTATPQAPGLASATSPRSSTSPTSPPSPRSDGDIGSTAC